MTKYTEAFTTVIIGTLVFTLGQIIQKFILEPIQKYKATVGKIDNKLKYYANILTNTGFESKTISSVSKTIRQLSCNLESTYKQIPFHKIFSYVGLVENKEEVGKVAKNLMYLSNAGGRNNDRIKNCYTKIKNVRNILKIKNI